MHFAAVPSGLVIGLVAGLVVAPFVPLPSSDE